MNLKAPRGAETSDISTKCTDLTHLGHWQRGVAGRCGYNKTLFTKVSPYLKVSKETLSRLCGSMMPMRVFVVSLTRAFSECSSETKPITSCRLQNSLPDAMTSKAKRTRAS